MKKIWIFAVLAALVFSGCQHRPEALFGERYSRFLELLDAQEAALFKKGEYSLAVQKFSGRLEKNRQLQADFQALKDEQNIVMFTPAQVFRMFGRTVFEKKRLLDFIGMLNEQQTDLFNRGEVDKLVASFAESLQKKPLAAEFSRLTGERNIDRTTVKRWASFFLKVLREEVDFYRQAPDGGAPDWKG